MKPALTIVLMLLALVGAPFTKAADALADRRRKTRLVAGISVPAMLAAIRAVETGNNPAAIGRRGERSAYQFMRGTWAIYTSNAFIEASTNQRLADMIAAAHLAYICRQLERRGMPREPMYIAAAWRHGPWFARAYVREDYAQRTANLYWSLAP